VLLVSELAREMPLAPYPVVLLFLMFEILFPLMVTPDVANASDIPLEVFVPELANPVIVLPDTTVFEADDPEVILIPIGAFAEAPV